MSVLRPSAVLKRFIVFALLVGPPGKFFNVRSSANEVSIPQCPAMRTQAVSFAQTCLDDARPLARIFYPGGSGTGQREVHSAYFLRAPQNSHFALGCTLDWRHQINFLGIYYSTNGAHFAKANSSEIRFIDFEGNAGFTIDGAPVTFLAVRQFGGDGIPLRHGDKIPKNCESPKLENRYVADGNGQFKIDGNFGSSNPQLTTCLGTSCSTRQFVTFFPESTGEIFYHQHALRLFISSTGTMFVEKESYERSCGEWYKNLSSTENIVTELCPQKK